ncbi:radical SAM protein [Pendulispora rubella]|uniref:Radical SAM protein n=1 Tax=Pendulispora rubella TaxID=2741070 RepID=A0ABZ2L5N9_9BACT
MPAFVLTLVLTHACNLACGYCYMGEHHRASMTPDVAERALALAFRRGEPVTVSFFGGEPLLEWDLLVHCARRARQLGAEHDIAVRLQMTTNGVLLTKEKLAQLCELGVHMTLSIDGIRAAHEAGRPRMGGGSSFDAVVQAAHRIVESGQALQVAAVVTPENVEHLANSVRFFANLGARRIYLNPAWEREFSEAHLAVWQRELEQVAALWKEARGTGRDLAIMTFDRKVLAAANGGLSRLEQCSMGSRNVAVAPSGNLYPCERLVADDRNPRFVIGTLDGGLDATTSIPRGPADPECAACPERFRCSSTCACANLAETNAADLPGPTQCWYERITAELADEASRALVEEQNESFLSWIYGDIMKRTAPTRAKAPRTIPTRGAVAAALLIATTAHAKDTESERTGRLKIIVPAEQSGEREAARGLVDGKRKPLNREIKLTPGRHQVAVVYPNGRIITRMLEIKEGKNPDAVYPPPDPPPPTLIPPKKSVDHDETPGGMPPSPRRDPGRNNQ